MELTKGCNCDELAYGADREYRWDELNSIKEAEPWEEVSEYEYCSNHHFACAYDN